MKEESLNLRPEFHEPISSLVIIVGESAGVGVH